MTGEITIKLPENRHLMTNLSAVLVGGVGGQWQCILCDKKADTTDELANRTCPSPRVYTITAH